MDIQSQNHEFPLSLALGAVYDDLADDVDPTFIAENQYNIVQYLAQARSKPNMAHFCDPTWFGCKPVPLSCPPLPRNRMVVIGIGKPPQTHLEPIQDRVESNM